MPKRNRRIRDKSRSSPLLELLLDVSFWFKFAHLFSLNRGRSLFVSPIAVIDQRHLRQIAITCFAVLVLFQLAALSSESGGTLHAQNPHNEDEANRTQITLGAKTPEGAIVLFDGSSFDQWVPFTYQWTPFADDAVKQANNQKEIQWKLIDGKAMEIVLGFEEEEQRQWLCSREKFGDYLLHVEFRLPMEGNSNAGLFFGPMYELQIFDTADKPTLGLTDCGSLYNVKTPDVNAALPRGQWQTYDLDYQHADVKENGRMTGSGGARMTARLNGVLIHDDVHLSLRRNKYAAYPEETTSRIILQDHGAKVQFRNIWLLKKPKPKNPLQRLIEETTRPKNPGTQLQLPIEGP